jgi:hypothetical protein
MRAANTFRALCLGALLGLTGCVTVHHDRDYGYEDDSEYERPPHGPRWVHYGLEHVYDVNVGVYTVVGHPHVYFHDGWYWRHTHGYWERCSRPYGGRWHRSQWSHVPPRLRPRYGGHHGDRDHDRWDRRDERHERREARHDERFERREDAHDRRDERWHERQGHSARRAERRDERADLRHDQRQERRAERHELGDGRHDRRDERWHDQNARTEQRRDQREAHQEQRRAERFEQRAERHHQRSERREERREHREERHDRRHGERDDAGHYAQSERE